jgi:UMF1 family MFS transporter
MGMFWFKGANVGWGITCFIFAVVGYVGSLVFYNSYLPEIADPIDHDRISARGYSLGYIGSVILQIVGFALVIYFSGKGDNASGPLYTFLLVGVWWIGFAQITFYKLPAGKPVEHKKGKNFLISGFIELANVWNQLKHNAVLKWYLFSFFFYSMGVQTVMLVATMFGSKMLKLPDDKLIITVVIIQLVAVIGAFTMSRLSAVFGNLRVLMGVVTFWIFICLAAFYVAHQSEAGMSVEYYFYGLAICVGLVMGGIQALSRSTYSKLMPVTHDTASYFSFYDVTEKFAIAIGVLIFGYIDELLGMHNSVLSLIAFFGLGFIGLVITRRKEFQSNRAVVY